MPGSRPTWYLTHEYAGRDPTCDLQKLQVAPLAVPLFLEGRHPRKDPGAYQKDNGLETPRRMLRSAAFSHR